MEQREAVPQWLQRTRHWWRLSTIPIHMIFPILMPSSEEVYQASVGRLVDSIEEHFPVFDDSYYELRVSSRSTGNIQESVPTPITFRPESLLVGIIRHFRRDHQTLERYIDKLIALGAQPDGITSDGPSWISPMVAIEIYMTDPSIRDAFQEKLMLHRADPNESGWCGKTVLHYRLGQFTKDPTEENLHDLVAWINLPQVRLDCPIFEWHPELSCRSLIDYLHDMSPNHLPMIQQILYSFGYEYIEEDVCTFPSIGDVIHGGTKYRFYQERIAIHWQLDWNQLVEDDWVRLLEILAVWVDNPKEFQHFVSGMWAPIEEKRKNSLEKTRFLMDSVQFNAPQKFPFSWTVSIIQSPERVYQVWGGYMQVLLQHPVHPQTGEMIPFDERKRLWSVYLGKTDDLRIYWKDEFTIPDAMETVIDNIREYTKTHEIDVRRTTDWIFSVPIHVFLSPNHDVREKRDSHAFRSTLDKLCSWFQKIHPYSNFHQILDHKKRTSAPFWKYMFQVLAYRPPMSDCIPLYPFEKWIEQHTAHRSPSYIMRLTVEDNDRSDFLKDWTLKKLQSAFVRCVYLCSRENLDGFHYRFEEEWNIIDFFFRSIDRFGKSAVRHQSDQYYSELVDFYRGQLEIYPYLTFPNLHKKMMALLAIFDPQSQQKDSRSPSPIFFQEEDDPSALLLHTISLLRPSRA